MKRLAEDHANAQRFAERLASRASGVLLDLTTVQTNIVVFSLSDARPGRERR